MQQHEQCNCAKQEVYEILQYVLRDHCSLRGACSRSNPDAIFRGFALWLRTPQILQPRWTTAKLSCKRFAWLLHWVANLRCLWTTDPWIHFLSSLYQFSTRSSSMASVEFCKIPPFPWPSMASMVAWTSIESIGWIAPWIPQKLSVESMETYRKRRKLMPLNFY